MLEQLISEFQNKKIVILGFGKEGKSTYKFLRKYLGNIHITIKDQNEKIKNDELIKDDHNLTIITGPEYLEDLEEFDIIMKTPGITFKNINIDKFKDKIYSQLEFILKYYRNNIIGITGTKGKSTTSSLMYNILQNNNVDSLLLGNIGNPIFDYLDNIHSDTILVIEMSSHQLEFINNSPKYAIITNFYQDHLDHTNGVEDYYNSKLNITRFQNTQDYLLYYEGCETLDIHIQSNNITSNILKVDFDNKQLPTYCTDDSIYVNGNKIYNTTDKRNLLGNHNLINIMLVLTLSNLLKLDNEKAIEAINSFIPLEHRLELVGTYNDITYYNDAIATIPEATINGIKALEKVNTLIFGGLDRGIDYSYFIEYLNQSNIENLICMPTTGHVIANKLQQKETNKNIYIVDTLEEAVEIAKEVTKKESICLMSPAAASYEYYKNFEEKGTAYKQLIKK